MSRATRRTTRQRAAKRNGQRAPRKLLPEDQLASRNDDSSSTDYDHNPIKTRDRKRLPSARYKAREALRRAATARLAEIAFMPLDDAVSKIHVLKLRQLDTARKACVDLLRALDREAQIDGDEYGDVVLDDPPRDSSEQSETNRRSEPECSPRIENPAHINVRLIRLPALDRETRLSETRVAQPNAPPAHACGFA